MGLGRFFTCFGLPGTLVLTLIMSVYALGAACVRPSGATWLVAAGMLLSSLGDIILMNYRPITDLLPFCGFAAGAAAFMAAHICYIAAYLTAAVRLAAQGGARLVTPALAIGGGLFALTLLLLFILHSRNAGASPAMTALCVTYLAVISSCLTAVFTFAFLRGSAGWISAIGALLFFLSDAVIGFDKVGGITFSHASDIIWVLYPLGQLMLITGMWV